MCMDSSPFEQSLKSELVKVLKDNTVRQHLTIECYSKSYSNDLKHSIQNKWFNYMQVEIV